MDKTRNTWADRWEDMAFGTGDPAETAMMRQEAEQAREYGTRTDSEGTVYFYRPGVGGWWSADRKLWKADA